MCTKKNRSRLARKEFRIAKTAYWKEQFKKTNTNKDFWKLVNKVKRKQKGCKISPRKDNQENSVIDDKQKAAVVNSYFTTIGQSLAEHMKSNTHIKNVEYIYRVTPTCQQLEMDEKHFNQQFKDLKPEKATGQDNVTSKELILADEAVKTRHKVNNQEKYYR